MKTKYKSFRDYSLECAHKGNRFCVPCVRCEQINLICVKYKTYCHSRVCLQERLNENS